MTRSSCSRGATAGVLALSSLLLLVPACGPSASSAPPAATMKCPEPVGTVPKEDCATIAADFNQFDVSGAASHTGAGKDAEQKREAIQAVATLAKSIRDQRLKLCEAYTKCQVPLEEHDTQDRLYASSMTTLFDLWNKRRFSRADEVVRFRDAVRAIDRRVNGGEAAPVALQAARAVKANTVFDRSQHPEVTFRADGGSVTIGATGDGERETLVSKGDSLGLTPGRRYRLNLTGSYRPAAPSAIHPGDELVVRVHVRAEHEGSVTLALRSLEDPEASEATETIPVVSGENPVKEVKLTADPRQSGFSLGFGSTTPVEVDALEVLRDGHPILTAKLGDAATRTACTSGKHGLACGPSSRSGDVITLGQPTGYVVFGVKDSTGRRASVRTQSLDGGRSIDTVVAYDPLLTVTLVGAGTAVFEQIEVNDLGT